jgi:uncharacterized protein (TIGR00725 family)
MKTRGKVRIGVIGGAKPDTRTMENAFKVGSLIAERGALLICGGLGGVMEAAAQGAKKAGGFTVGILPGNDPHDANPYIDIPLATGMGYTRNSLVAMNSDVIIAIDGEFGTLSEIAYGQIYEKKVIGLETWDIEGTIRATSPEHAIELALMK